MRQDFQRGTAPGAPWAWEGVSSKWPLTWRRYPYSEIGGSPDPSSGPVIRSTLNGSEGAIRETFASNSECFGGSLRPTTARIYKPSVNSQGA